MSVVKSKRGKSKFEVLVKANSDIEYLAMMTNNELEQEETDDAGEEI